MDRKDYIGSSDARDILSGDFDRVYSIKKGLIEFPDLSDNFKVQFGKHNEPFHCTWTVKRLSEETGGAYKWSRYDTSSDKPPETEHFATFESENEFVLGSHPDALLLYAGKRVYPLEVKHTGRFRSADEAADFYMPQLQHHMMCWNTDLILFSVIIGNEEPERIWIGASQEWQEHYLDACKRFWAHMVSGERPAPLMTDVKTPTVVVPAKVADTVPRNGWKKRSLDGDNQAPALIDEFLMTKEYVKRHDQAKADLKALMRDDENELYGDKLTLKRNVKGSILINIAKEK